MEKNKISVIIPNWNGKNWLKKSLIDLSKQTYKNFEIIVIDNNSNDNSVSWLKKKFPKVKVIKSHINLGFGKANNLGVKHSNGSEILLLNNDTKFKPDFLEKLLTFKQKTKTNIVGPRLLDFNGHDPYHSKKLSIDPLSVHGWGKKIFFVEGCALMISKKDYLKLEGFDPAYFMYSEDIDFCWRAWMYGMKIDVCKDLALIHFGGGSSQQTRKQKQVRHIAPLSRRFEVEKNNLRNILKNFQFINLPWILLLYLFQTIAEIILYFLTGNFPVIKITLKAISWNLVNIMDTLKERKRIQSGRMVNDYKILKIMTPPFNKVRTFLQIGLPNFI